jgi:hypothetical protein
VLKTFVLPTEQLATTKSDRVELDENHPLRTHGGIHAFLRVPALGPLGEWCILKPSPGVGPWPEEQTAAYCDYVDNAKQAIGAFLDAHARFIEVLGQNPLAPAKRARDDEEEEEEEATPSIKRQRVVVSD